MAGPATHAIDTTGLKAGDMTGVEKDEEGKFTSTRSERGRKHALSMLENEEYRKALLERMIRGTAGPVEVWVWRIGYGDPPRAKDEDEGDAERFEKMRLRVREFMKRYPAEARAMRNVLARGVPVEALPEGTPIEASGEDA